MPDGIDVAYPQKTVEWSTVKYLHPDIKVTIARACYGTYYPDDYWDWNWPRMRAEGFDVRAPYLFATTQNAKAQADYYCSLVDNFDSGPPIIDAETWSLNGDLIWSIADRIEFNTGRRPWIYTYPSVGSYLFGSNPEWAEKFYLWVAHYGIRTPDIPAPWSSAIMWQYGGAPINGILDGNTDVDVNTVFDWAAVGADKPIVPVQRVRRAKDMEFKVRTDKAGNPITFGWAGFPNPCWALDVPYAAAGDIVAISLISPDDQVFNAQVVGAETQLVQWGQPAVWHASGGFTSIVIPADPRLRWRAVLV